MHYDIEYNGGLGDVFNQLYRFGWHNLEDLTAHDRATVWMICHNPFARELFQNHPKRHLITVNDVTGKADWWGKDRARRRQKAIKKQLGMPWRLHLARGRLFSWIETASRSPCFAKLAWPAIVSDNSPKRPIRFYPLGSEDALLAALPEQFITLCASAGGNDRSIPQSALAPILDQIIGAKHAVVAFGRTYEGLDGRRSELAVTHPAVTNLTDRLSVPATAEALRRCSGLITCHTSLSILAWHMNKPQLLLYPETVKVRHFLAPDDSSFGKDRANTVHGLFSECSTEMVQRFLACIEHGRGLTKRSACLKSGG